MNLLTLDTSSRNTGWTLGDALDPQFASGAQAFPSTGDDVGEFLSMFEDWLATALAGVELCVFEAPILNVRKASLPILRKLYGATGFVDWACNRRGIPCHQVNNQAVKAFMACRRGRGIDPKKAMMEAVQRLGCAPKTHDEADAIAIRYYTIHQMFPEARRAFSLELGALGMVAA